MTGGQPKPRRGPFSVSVALSVVLHALVFCALVLFVRPAKERVAPVPRPEPRMARPGTPLPSAEHERSDLLGSSGPGGTKPEPSAAKELPAPPAPGSPRPGSNFGRAPAPPPPTREAP